MPSDEPDSDSHYFDTQEEGELYAAEAILGERYKTFLVKWAGVDPATGKLWEDSWVPKKDVTPDLVKVWHAKKRENRKAKNKAVSKQNHASSASRRNKSLVAKAPAIFLGSSVSSSTNFPPKAASSNISKPETSTASTALHQQYEDFYDHIPTASTSNHDNSQHSLSVVPDSQESFVLPVPVTSESLPKPTIRKRKAISSFPDPLKSQQLSQLQSQDDIRPAKRHKPDNAIHEGKLKCQSHHNEALAISSPYVPLLSQGAQLRLQQWERDVEEDVSHILSQDAQQRLAQWEAEIAELERTSANEVLNASPPPVKSLSPQQLESSSSYGVVLVPRTQSDVGPFTQKRRREKFPSDEVIPETQPDPSDKTSSQPRAASSPPSIVAPKGRTLKILKPIPRIPPSVFFPAGPSRTARLLSSSVPETIISASPHSRDDTNIEEFSSPEREPIKYPKFESRLERHDDAPDLRVMEKGIAMAETFRKEKMKKQGRVGPKKKIPLPPPRVFVAQEAAVEGLQPQRFQPSHEDSRTEESGHTPPKFPTNIITLREEEEESTQDLVSEQIEFERIRRERTASHPLQESQLSKPTQIDTFDDFGCAQPKSVVTVESQISTSENTSQNGTAAFSEQVSDLQARIKQLEAERASLETDRDAWRRLALTYVPRDTSLTTNEASILDEDVNTLVRVTCVELLEANKNLKNKLAFQEEMANKKEVRTLQDLQSRLNVENTEFQKQSPEKPASQEECIQLSEERLSQSRKSLSKPQPSAESTDLVFCCAWGTDGKLCRKHFHTKMGLAAHMNKTHSVLYMPAPRPA